MSVEPGLTDSAEYRAAVLAYLELLGWPRSEVKPSVGVLRQAVALRSGADTLVVRVVESARAGSDPMTWVAIGSALGMTGAGAQQWFRRAQARGE